MARIKDFFNLVKIEHTLFALPFALIGYTLGGKAIGNFLNLEILLAVLLCMFFARNAAMAFNRFLDRDIDSKNKRTAGREIPAGMVKSREALIFVIVNSILFWATTWFINPLCFSLAPIALFIILFYSYTKRLTSLCHFVLSIGLAIAPIGAYIAMTGNFSMDALWYSLIVFFWSSCFDIIYALQDEEFDRKEGLHSIPVLFSRKRALSIARIGHCIAGVLIIINGVVVEYGALYYIGAAIFIAALIYQNSIVKENDLSRVNLAFGTTNGASSVVFGIFVILDIILL
ncbi:MAG: UbiA-like polyprenyltransferase [Bacteroidales bacterium]